MTNTSGEFEKQIVAVMRGCGCDAADIFAFKQTGVLINRQHLIPLTARSLRGG